MATLRLALAKKDACFARIQKVYDFTKKLSDKEILQKFMVHSKSIPTLRLEFIEAYEKWQLLYMEEDDSVSPTYAPIEAVNDMCDYIYANLADIENKIKAKTPAAEAAPTLPRLPKLEIIEFDGSQEKWPVFYQLFDKLIHENKSLSNLEKINYLVAHLKGPARTVCSGVLPTAENYQAIYKSLIDRYEDKRQLAATYLNKILEFKPIQQESEKYLNLFLEQYVESVAALKQLNIEELADFIFTHIALKKLDNATALNFEMSSRKKDMPTFQDLVLFVREQAKILHRTKKGCISSVTRPNFTTKNSHTLVVTKEDTNPIKSVVKCFVCNQLTHQLYKCPKFIKMSIEERWESAKKCNACFNCLSVKSHTSTNCASKSVCSKCNYRHHSLLHKDKKYTANPDANEISEQKPVPKYNAESSERSINFSANVIKPYENKNVSVSKNKQMPATTVLLATAIVEVKDVNGKFQRVRALIDNGSQSHLITPGCCKKLGLPLIGTSIAVKGIGFGGLNPKSSTVIKFRSVYNHDATYSISALVTEFLNDELPTLPIPCNNFTHLNKLKLADPEFRTPNKIDLLIGAELWPLLSGTKKVVGSPQTPVAIESALGYLIMGSVEVQEPQTINRNNCIVEQLTLEELVKRFWTIEEVPQANTLSEEEKKCENLFLSAFSRDEAGKFSVPLLFKESPSMLGDSKESAICKFLALEKRLKRTPDIFNQYKTILKEYLEKGYISLMPPDKSNENSQYFMAHHCIVKPGNTSTPIRIVFNASAKSSNACSLNSLLHIGPKLYSDIFDILLNFRMFKFALCADVSKMYLQIYVNKEERKYQRFIWRSNDEEEIQIYEFNTLVFGMRSSPYLALKVVKLLAEGEKPRYPLAHEVVMRDVYMDDVVTSVPDQDLAYQLYNQLVNLFQSGGFSLVKWCSNSQEILEKIPDERRRGSALEFDQTSSAKVLGMHWSTVEDMLFFKFDLPVVECTKRNILSIIARMFDPLGLLAPVTIVAKLLIKELWSAHIGWDEMPPQRIIKVWSELYSSLSVLSTIKIPRHVYTTPIAVVSLIGFSDASEKAYGAAVYVKTQIKDEYKVALLCAKSKVAPMKLMTIPRLELCAATLLAKLMRYVIDVYNKRININSITACTDSMVTLYWIQSDPSRWKSFVANRTAQVRENLDPGCWKHISSQNNISDCLSRGLSPEELLKYPTWLTGPSWLNKRKEDWPTTDRCGQLTAEAIEETKQLKTAAVVVENEFVLSPLLNRVSNLKKLLKVTAIVIKFLRSKSIVKYPITVEDLNEAETIWIKSIQARCFSDCLHKLSNKLPAPKVLRKLDPFLKEDVIRVGGRLQYSTLSYDQRHPILLPKHDRFVDLLIEHYHCENLHTGAHLVLSLLRLKYWILAARSQVRHRIKKCNICFKVRPTPLSPQMAPLPEYRVHPVKAFTHTGVDYAGPFVIASSRIRKLKPQKAYIALFICLTVKAVHLELVSELSTNCFLNAFKRFLARRGPCSKMYSDCGTNFIGARNKLDEIHRLLISDDYRNNFGNELVRRKVEWNLIPPSAPHFGGMWESNIKSVKTHLKRVIGHEILTYEEFTTVLCQTEALLNSRPLAILCDDPNSPTALTPAHFLTLTSTLDYLPASDIKDEPINRLSRYQLLDRIVQDYWKRWHLEYLQSLQTRNRWTEKSENVKEGTIVVVMESNSLPLQWPLGVVVKTFPGKDGIIRVVEVSTKRGTYRRPVVKLCPLPTQ